MLDGPSLETEFEDALLARRISELASGNLFVLISYLLCIALMTVTLINRDNALVLLVWSAITAALLLARLYITRGTEQHSVDRHYLRKHWQIPQLLGVATSTSWAVMIPYFAVQAEGRELAVVAVLVMAVFMGSLLYRAPTAARRFHIIALTTSVVFGGWLVAGPASAGTAAMALLLCVTMLIALKGQDRVFVASVVSELKRQEAADTVALLLNDYEEQSSDWLWTVGPRGNLRGVAARFAAAAGRDVDALEGAPLLQLFMPGDQRDRLARHLVERSAFRDLLVKLRVDGELRYWRLSARPRDDGRLSGVARDVTNNQLIKDRVAFMAHYDNLTGLANRYLFNERLRKMLDHPDSAGCVALFYIDLDDFKAINDMRGHGVGDRLLREVGARLEHEIREDDLVARLGGDEFAVLIETRAGAGMLIERAHRFLSVIREPYELEGQLYRISSSVGVARCSEGDCDADELMRRADLALYSAKAKGRDNLALFEPALDKAARERRTIETDLREAVPRGQLRMHYQPVIDLDTGATTSYEALLRWYHPQRGIVAPGEFLKIAEETGLIMLIGDWVIRQTLSEISTWPGDFRIAINLSPTQVLSPHLVALVAQAIDANGIAPERIEFEITEHVLMAEGDASYNALLRLRELGTKIALDDFGTGYSSLSYLRRFPFDRIKIDRHFVERIEDNTHDQAIVSSVTRLADAMGMQTTAEGIERRGQLDLLRKLGCNEAQGFLICHPLPGEAVYPGDHNDSVAAEHSDDLLAYRKARDTINNHRGGQVA
ncbi:putative bifunctional diguanylate cyclase/phosphodiesterase [Qipengyuania marisflavi]|nr:EAL domain-containing protein [Qipengyuania marisflavi]